MVKSRINLRNVQNVAVSKTAIIDLPIGQRYHYVELLHGFTGGTNSIVGGCLNILEIRVLVNGRVQRVFSGTQLRDRNLLNGTSYDCTGVPNPIVVDAGWNQGMTLPIFMAEPWRFDEMDQDALAWPTVRVDGKNLFDNFQIQVDLGAAASPTLTAVAVVDDGQAGPNWLGIVKHLRFSIPAGGNKFDWAIVDRRDFLQQISLYPDSGASLKLSPVTLRIAGRILHELTLGDNAAVNTNWGMTPAAAGRTANIYDLVLDHDGNLASAINMNGVRDATLTIQSAAAGSMSGTIIAQVDRVGPPE